ncbi:MAG: hypothetical protein HYS32_04025 [Candidatus Woesearchaeota archaeon]|nr:MAG: hypothetical protein HYS32_04025 [Candidatus Woesearchaeota archaeon]
MKKQVLILLILTLVLVTSVLAEPSFEIKANQLTEKVTPNSIIEFNLTLINKDLGTKLILLTGRSASTIKFYRFTPSESPLELTSRQPLQVLAEVALAADIKPQKNYPITFYVNSLDKTIKAEKIVIVNVQPYDLPVDISIEPERQISPGKENTFTLHLKNKAIDFLDNVEVVVDSAVFTEKLEEVDLPPLKTTDVTVTALFPPSTRPSTYPIKVEVSLDNKQVGYSTGDFDVVPFEDLKETSLTDDSLFSKKLIAIKSNQGNIPVIAYHKVTLTPYQKLFASFNLEPIRVTKEGKQYTYEWEVPLQPRTEAKIITEISHLAFIVIIVLIVIAIILLFLWLNSGIIITKKVLRANDNNIKIALIIKNNLSHSISNVKLIERLPGAVHPSKEFGTTTPDKIERLTHGFHLIWNLHLDKGEERIFTYSFEPKMHVVGGIVLPTAVAKYMHKGKEVVHHSNSLTIVRK